METTRRHVPNSPDGTWHGTWPLHGGSFPSYGMCVVYVLYDHANAPCYVGSTQNLKVRLKWHAGDGKAFRQWTAFRCADRAAAYALEDRLLAEHKPYLNKKAAR
jgi:hypothetical protein